MAETPLERLRARGVTGLDPFDLLAFCVAKDEHDIDMALDRATELLRRFKLHGVGDLSRTDLAQVSELTDFEATRVLAALQLGKRVGMSGRERPEILDSPKAAMDFLADLADEKKEHFVAVLLNSKNGVIARKTIHIGSVNMSLVSVAAVFREAIREGAVSLIVAHNHPSGDPSPSPEDIEITHKLAEVGDMLDIPLRDHLIIGHHGSISLKREGVL